MDDYIANISFWKAMSSQDLRDPIQVLEDFLWVPGHLDCRYHFICLYL